MAYTAEFTSNVEAFIAEISRGLQQLEERVQAAGGKIDATSIGRDLGQGLVNQFSIAADQIEQRATALGDSIKARLRAATIKAEDSGASAGSTFRSPLGGATTSESYAGLAKEGIAQIGQALRTGLASLPPELESAAPAMRAVARQLAEDLVTSLRKTEQAVNSELRNTLGADSRGVIGRSTVTNSGRAAINEQLGPAASIQGISDAELTRARQLLIDAYTGHAQAEQRAALETLSSVSKGQLLREAKDPNNPNTYFGRPGAPTFAAGDPITREDALGNKVHFAAIRNLEPGPAEQDPAIVLNAQNEASARARVTAAEEKNVEAAEKAQAAAEQEARVRELFSRALQGEVTALGGATSPRFFRDNASGQLLSARTGLPPQTSQEQYQANVLAQQQSNRAAAAQARAQGVQNPSPFNSFLGGLTSRGYEAPGTGLASLFGTTGVLTRYAAAGAGIGALYAALTQLKQGIVGVNQSETELSITTASLGHVTVDTTDAFGQLASSGIDAQSAFEVGTQALRIYQDEIHSSNDATTVFNQTVQQSGIIALNSGLDLKQAAQYMNEANEGFQLGSQGGSRIADAIENAKKNFGGSAPDIAQALGSSSNAAREAGLSPEQAANIFSLVQSRTGLSGSSLGSQFDRLLNTSGGGSFRQALDYANIPNTGDLTTELQQLSVHYNGLDTAAKAAFERQLSGGRAIQFLLPILRDGGRFAQANADSLKNSGAASNDFERRINSLAGELKQIGALLKDLFQNLGRSGIFTGFGLALEALKPMLQLINGLLVAFNKLPVALRDTVGGLLDLVIAYKVFSAIRNPDALRFIPGIKGRGAPGAVAGAEEVGTATTGLATTITTGSERVAAALGGAAATIAGASETAGAEIAAGGGAAAAEVEAGGAAQGVAGATAGGVGLLGRLGGFLRRPIGARYLAGDLAGASSRALEGEGSIAARGVGGLAGVGSAVLPYAVAALAGYATYSTLNDSRRRIEGAEGAGLNTLSGPTNLNDLGGSASALKSAANDISKASGGFIGTITGGLDELFGGANRGAEKALLQRTAEARTAEAAAIAAATPKSGASAIDLSSTDNLNHSVQTLQQRGATATQVIDALTGAIDQLTTVAATGKRQLLPGQGPELAAKAGGSIVNNLIADAALRLPQYQTSGSNAGNPYAEAALQQITHVDQKKLAADLQGDIDAHIKQQGYDAGKPINTKELFAFAQEQVKTRLHLTAAQFAALPGELQTQLLTDAKIGIADALKSTTGDRNGATPQQLAATADQIIQAAPQAGTDAASLATHTGNSLGAGLAGANATLAGLGKGRDALQRAIKASKNPQDIKEETTKLQQLNLQIIAAQNAVTDATVAHIQAQSALATSTVSEFDKGGQINSQVAGLQQQLNKTTEVDKRAGLQAQINGLRNQQQDQNIADVNSARDAAVDPRDKTGQLLAAYQDAETSYNNVRTRGGTGAALSDALKKKNDAQRAYKDQLVSDSNSVRDSSVAIGDQVGAAMAQYADAMNSAANDLPGSAQQAADLHSAAQHYAEALKAGADITNSQISLSTNQRSPVALARSKITQDQVSLSAIPQADIAARNNQLVQIEQDVIAYQNTIGQFVATVASSKADPKSKVSQAQAQITAAKALLATSTPDQSEYWQALGQLIQGESALGDALVQARSTAEQLHEDITDPLVQAKQAVRDAQRTLITDRAKGRSSDVIQADQLDLVNKENASQKAFFDERLAAIQVQFQLHRSSSVQYVRYLQSLRKQITGDSYQAQQERNQVDQALQAAYGQLEGQFNLGDIKVPTVYEVRRTLASAQAGTGYSDNRVTSITINGIDSTQAIVQVVKQQLGTSAAVRRAPVATRRA